MTTLELETYLNTQIEENPFLDFEEPEKVGLDRPLEFGYSNQSISNETNANREDSLSSCKTLKEVLMEQIPILLDNNKDRIAATIITDLIDDNGYLELPKKEIATLIGASQEYLNRLLLTLQKAEPSGVYSSTLKECLEIQLREKNKLTPKLALLLDNLALLAKCELKKLCQILKVTDSELKSLIEVIKTLDPKPGRNFSKEISRTKIPDAIIFKDSQSSYSVVLNGFAYSQLMLKDALYKQAMNASKGDDRKYCMAQFKEASNTYRAIKQRSETVLKLAGLIAEKQYEFFEYGIEYLKPMKLKDAAIKLGFHDSTICRTNNKVVATPRGIFELGYFFTNALQSNLTEDTFSSKSVKNKIMALIKSELTGSILSDDDIASKLKEEGIKISRRTVTKYREALKIEPSNIRKRQKRLRKTFT
jgi:RNA polymerase sigma-54 factor